MSACRFLLLGPPQIERDKQVALIKSRKAIALIAYLAVEQRAFSREYLAALLWSSLGLKRALANLRRTLSLLRGTFGNGCIVTDGDQVKVNRTFINLDIDEFYSLLRPQSSDPDLVRLEAATELYRGSFMEGFNLGDCLEFDLWQDAVRERLRLELDSLLETLSRRYLKLGQPKLALPYALRWLEQDQCNEAAHRALMEIYVRTSRTNAARKQYKYCTQTLSQEGLEPEDRTRELYEAIVEKRLTPSAGRAQVSTLHPEPSLKKKRRVRPLCLSRWLAYLSVVVLTIIVSIAVHTLVGFFTGSDLKVAALKVFKSGDELAGVRIVFCNEGFARRKASYSVVFSANPVIGATRDFLAYSDDLRIGRNRKVTLEISCLHNIQEFVDVNDVRIPPGNYTLRVVIDSRTSTPEHSEFNNRLASSERFFYAGTTGIKVFGVEVRYSGQDPLDDANPLKVFISDRAKCYDPINWGWFRVTRQGKYYFPLDDIPCRDIDGSGYFMLIIHDAGDDLQNPYFIDTGDVIALYKDVAYNLVYGTFTVDSGTPVYPGEIYPGEIYTIDFSLPLLPAPDIYETDDKDVTATLIDYAVLPVRQFHTFHDEGNTNTDEDWFRVFLKADDSLTVETFSAGGKWESDTAIDLNDSQMNYIGSVHDKSSDDNYSKMTYKNETGVDQVFYILVKPLNQPNNISKYQTGEYMVEFR